MTPERWRQIKQLFQAAIELAEADRDTFLASQAAGDEDLRRQVEQMLRHATGAGLLDRPAWDGVTIDHTIAPGDRLGPYEILREAGAGGMGRVYKACDTRLGRTVAIKVLHAEFSDRARMEGRAISALNHPHVCALYDIGDQDGTAYLVMEYVEGESLAARLAKGALCVDEVLRYGAEIASALAAAHARGIVHRDLKPANIMITASGVKVLDFGVAQSARDADTSPGAVAGTEAYMSPSQLNGNPADARTDVFALGLVLYEMISGIRPARPFPKPLTNAPAGLTHLMERCLQPDSARRIQSMDEVRAALEALRSPSARTPRARSLAAAGALLLAVAAGTAILTWRTNSTGSRQIAASPTVIARDIAGNRKPQPAEAAPSSKPKPPVSIVHAAPPPPPSLVTLSAYPGLQRDPSFSPDGTQVAFSWQGPLRSGFGIYVRALRSDEPATALTGGAEDWGPAWSPDGRRIAFRRSQAGRFGIFWVPASGGPSNLISTIARQGQETLPQMSWSHDGKWIAAPDRDGSHATRIYLFSVESGEKRAITDNPVGTDHAPAFSPNGKQLAYASCTGAVYPCDVYVVDLARDLVPVERRRITKGGIYVRGLAWLPDGKSLVYAAGPRVAGDTYLWRVRVNPPGDPEPIDMAGSQARHPAVSKTGGFLAYTRLGSWNLMMIKHFY